MYDGIGRVYIFLIKMNAFFRKHINSDGKIIKSIS